MLLAFEKLGLSRNYKYVSSVKQQLEPALEELIESGYLQAAEFVGRGEATTVRFTVGKGREGKKSRSTPLPAAAPLAVAAPRALVADEPPTVSPARVPLEEMRRRSVLEMLISRGLSRNQVEQILRPCSLEVLTHIEQIISYYDHLEATKGAQAFRNGPGFLFKAVSAPDQFTIPQSFLLSRGIAAKSQNRPVRRDPAIELKESQIQQEFQKKYQAFREGALREIRSSLDSAQLDGHYRRVREKLACLKGVLEKSRFEEAVEGCVNDELAKIQALPSEQDWMKQQSAVQQRSVE